MDLNIRGFKYKEFDCKCNRDCDCKNINGINHPTIDSVIIYLEVLRKYLYLLYKTTDIKIIITSGLRCYEHNKEIGGVAHSDHLYGRAVDIQVYINGYKLNDKKLIRTLKVILPMQIRYIAPTSKTKGAVHISFERLCL